MPIARNGIGLSSSQGGVRRSAWGFSAEEEAQRRVAGH